MQDGRERRMGTRPRLREGRLFAGMTERCGGRDNPFTLSSLPAAGGRRCLDRRVSKGPPEARTGARNLDVNAGVGPTQGLSRAGPSIHPDEASGHSG